jgi:hypothetical protein
MPTSNHFILKNISNNISKNISKKKSNNISKSNDFVLNMKQIDFNCDVNECCICLYELTNELILTSCCKNELHENCLIEYILYSGYFTCPLCRQQTKISINKFLNFNINDSKLNKTILVRNLEKLTNENLYNNHSNYYHCVCCIICILLMFLTITLIILYFFSKIK